MDEPEVRYARSGNIHIAYSVFGHGAVDLVYGRTAISQLELVWEEPTVAEFFSQLGEFSRVILWDKRGVGLSDRVAGNPTLEDRMDDVRAVMDAAQSRHAVVFGATDTAAMALLFAATYPERTRGLILIEPIAKGVWSDDFPLVPTREAVEQEIRQSEADWGSPAHIERLVRTLAPSRAEDPAFNRWFGRVVRFGSSPSAAANLSRMNMEIDVRGALGAVHVPTLILKCPGDRSVSQAAVDYVVDHLPNRQVVSVPGHDHFFWANPEASAATLTAQRKFIAELPTSPPEDERILKSVVFVDVVESTRQAAALGDRRWHELMDQFLSEARAEIGRFRGRLVKTTGDGFLAVFDGPTRAVRCAQAVLATEQRRGLELRAGVHAGECIVQKDDVTGIAVHIASRICDEANGGEILTSRTVRDLSVGSDVRFREHGTRSLKGLDGTWETYLASGG